VADEVALEELVEEDSPITYGVVKPGPEDPNGVLFVRGGDVANGQILISQLRTITKEVSGQYNRTMLRGGELIVSLVGVFFKRKWTQFNNENEPS
jgi:type I restriction enzyme, S subunit